MRLYTKLLRNLLLPLGDIAFGQHMLQRLKFREQAQYWPLPVIEKRQVRDLSALIQIAYAEVPFYRQLMDSRDLEPEQIRTVADLQQLPIVSKAMLRAGYPQQTTRKTGQKSYEVSTSGSTGKNFYVREDASTAGIYRASFLLAAEWAGWQIGNKHLQTGMSTDRGFTKQLKDTLLRCHYFSAYDLSDEKLDQMLTALERHHIRYLWGYPGSLYYLARRATALGWNSSLASVITWGDTLFPHYRQTIEMAFQTRVFDTYGCGEGFQISAQCEQGNYHLHALDTIVEFVDAEGLPVPAGRPGNIIVTRLHPGPMPLIRYAVGDIGIAGDGTACACGRGYPLMHSIQGRSTDNVLTPAGNRIIVHFFTGVLEHFPEIDSFQVVQNTLSAITIRIVPNTSIGTHKLNEIREALASRGARDLDIQFELVESIPLPISGKHRFIISTLTEAQHGNL